MCYRPLSIRNPKLCKNHVYDRSIIEVPCGHCESCKDTKRLSWFVRLYYEWQYCISRGGFGLFETLTYNEEHIPKIFDNFEFPELKKYGFRYTKGLRCFSVRDIQLYLKRLRKYISKCYPEADLKGCVKYFCTMEMGSKTHRPHYHVLFFVSSPLIDRYIFKSFVEELWSEKGFTKEGKYNNGFVCDVGGLSYTVKYVCKDLYDEEYFCVLEHILKRNGLKKEEYRQYFPSHLQSQGLGLYALQCDELNDLDNFLNGDIYLPDRDNVVRKYKLPLYFERKLFYDIKYRYFDPLCNEYIIVDTISEVPFDLCYSPVYILNALGLEMKDVRLQKSIDAVSNIYRVVLALPDDADYLKELNYVYKTTYRSIKGFQRYVKTNVSEETFVAYSLVYRGCVSVNLPYRPCDCSISVRDDYNLIQSMSAGSRPLSVDYNHLCQNIDYFNSLPLLPDIYNQVRFLFGFVQKQKEIIKREEEKYYLDQKTLFLQRTECDCLT